MSEEKKDELNEQQTFLNEQEGQPKPVSEEKPVESSDEQEAVPAPETGEAEPIEETDSSAPEEQTEIPQEPLAEEETPVSVPSESEAVAEPAMETLAPTGKQKSKPQPQTHSPQHEEVLKKQALEQSEVKEVLVFLRKYAKPAAIIIVLVCAFVLVDKFRTSKRAAKEAKADTALMAAQGTLDLENIVDQYGSTAAGPMAMMELAREYFNDGRIDAAEELYKRFTKTYGSHEMAPQAELNIALCAEVKGGLDDALQLYTAFAENRGTSYLAPSALLGKGRCLEGLGRNDEARTVYEDIVVNYPDSVWAPDAQSALKALSN